MPDIPDPARLLAALLREDLWLKFWEQQDNLFVEPLVTNDPEGNVWEIIGVSAPGDGTLRVTTIESDVETAFVLSIERED